MKGIILAGGQGSRLLPLTNIVNKFLLPVYNKPLIEYSIQSLIDAGITEIAIVLGTKSAGHTIEYLKSGERYNANFTYFFQEKPLGVANALSYVKDFANNQPIAVMCADNIIIDNIKPFVEDYKDGCFISCKQFDDIEELKRFAVAKFEDNVIVEFEEKPKNPGSNLAFAGVQIYDEKVFDIIDTLELSSRGEYEITHVINKYIKDNKFNHGVLKHEWIDAGTPDSLLNAQITIYNLLNKDKE